MYDFFLWFFNFYFTNGITSIGGKNTFGLGGVGGRSNKNSSTISLTVAATVTLSSVFSKSFEDLTSASNIGLIEGCSYFLCFAYIWDCVSICVKLNNNICMSLVRVEMVRKCSWKIK